MGKDRSYCVGVIRIGDVVETSPKLTPNAAALRGDTGEGLGARCENGRDTSGEARKRVFLLTSEWRGSG